MLINYLTSLETTHFNAQSCQNGNVAWAPDRPDVKIKNHGLGQYGAEPLIARLSTWGVKGLTESSLVRMSLAASAETRRRS